MILLAFLAFLGPSFEGVATAETFVETVPAPDRHGTLDEITADLERVQDRLSTMDPAALDEARVAATVAIRNCPYNRSAVQIPLAMRRVLARHDAPELAGVKATLDTHLAVLDTLHVTQLAPPRAGDYLRADLEGVYSGAQLTQLDDPVAGATLLVMQIRELVNAYPPETTARISAALEQVHSATNSEWEFKTALLVYRNQLEWELNQGTLDPGAAADVAAVVALIEEFASLRC